MTVVEHDRGLLDDRYELHHLIAAGGMGEVWRGRDVRFDRPVAVKILRSEYAGDPTFAARFRAEATHAAALHHPNIAAVHDYGETASAATGERIAYLVMELVEGDPLSTRFSEEGALAPADALSVLRQAAAALAEAHRAGVVHRDVKPANILIDRDGQVKLTDFGIAWSAASVPITRTGQVIGTPQYMSPEQAAGEPPRPASDVYALGLVGYESLTGRAAFDGDNPVTIALKQVQQEPEPLPAAIPEQIRSLIDGALVKDPDVRFPDADAFLDAIDATLEGRFPPGPATRTLPVSAAGVRPSPSGGGGAPADHPTTAAGAPAVDGAAAAPTRSLPGRKATPPPVAGTSGGWRSWPLVVALLVLLLGAGVGATVLGLSDSDPPTAGSAAAATAPETEPGAIVLTAGDYVGRPVEDVAADLTALGLDVERRQRVTGEHAPGTVAALEPVGVGLSPGDQVRLHVAVAPPAAPGSDGAGAAGGGGSIPSGAGDSPRPGTGAEAPTTGGPGSAEGGPAPAPAGDGGLGDPAGDAGPGPETGATEEPATPPSAPPDTGDDTGTDPTPSDPAPSDPSPSDPSPSDPAPSDPSPSDPSPSDSAPSDPAPSDPSPSEPSPSGGEQDEATGSEPATTSAPSEPASSPPATG
ncbi:serine/threonine-protein kinase [Blastococcus colisei]|uniref:non-specific serine/threonine protein kinase n=1 Tax=Blastococcus colisei TaxID=1564162 RepID=A0A543PF23_9ACTN|nr:serine/threonine protein kinase [Blastococcus colisei]TQN42678.1 serine/threonine-protein kinase [Blastococcus colisei]